MYEYVVVVCEFGVFVVDYCEVDCFVVFWVFGVVDEVDYCVLVEIVEVVYFVDDCDCVVECVE